MPVFIPWTLVGVVLGKAIIFTTLALVMSLWFGTGFLIEGYLSIRSLIRRKKYVGALIDFIFHGFGVMIALVVLYTMMVHGIIRK
ncbi:MAG TPA: hypothetical protein VLQ90_04950 [Pyrinomonadaceae bacterium]|nr:hypothetical protein [Pyrinomonadaceae bacterium]